MAAAGGGVGRGVGRAEPASDPRCLVVDRVAPQVALARKLPPWILSTQIQAGRGGGSRWCPRPAVEYLLGMGNPAAWGATKRMSARTSRAEPRTALSIVLQVQKGKITSTIHDSIASPSVNLRSRGLYGPNGTSPAESVQMLRKGEEGQWVSRPNRGGRV